MEPKERGWFSSTVMRAERMTGNTHGARGSSIRREKVEALGAGAGRTPPDETTQRPGARADRSLGSGRKQTTTEMNRRVRLGPAGRGDHSPCEREKTARASAGSAPPPGGPAPGCGTLWTPEDHASVASGRSKPLCCVSSPRGSLPYGPTKMVWRICFQRSRKARQRRQSPGAIALLELAPTRTTRVATGGS